MKTFTCTFKRAGATVAQLVARYRFDMCSAPLTKWSGDALLTPAWRDFSVCDGMDFRRRAEMFAAAAGVDVTIDERGQWEHVEQ